MEKFVAEPDLGAVVGLPSHGRIKTVALEPAEISKCVAFFVHAVQPYRDILVDRLVDIHGGAPVEIGARLQNHLPQDRPIRLFECAVDETAAGTATEG